MCLMVDIYQRSMIKYEAVIVCWLHLLVYVMYLALQSIVFSGSIILVVSDSGSNDSKIMCTS